MGGNPTLEGRETRNWELEIDFMNIVESTRAYERWLAAHTHLVAADIKRKHQFMAEALFPFFRATFYRWLQLWPSACPDLRHAPCVLSVGDLHVENFGTWRDAEGRLVWGINDFDEAARLPCTLDLVRLATSALLAIEDEGLALKQRSSCDRIAEGYADAIKAGGQPFVLAEQNRFLRDIAAQQLKDPRKYWDRMQSWPDAKPGTVPKEVVAILASKMPRPKPKYRVVDRQAGLGSRGHQRFVAIYSLYGGLVAREAKALVPSAANWVDQRHTPEVLYAEILKRAIRVPDVTFEIHGPWLLRRLAPDCTKIPLTELPDRLNEERLLYCMGWETANIHLGTKTAVAEISKDLKQRKADWLYIAARDMAKLARKDWKDWRAAQK
jgi:hypothetical protein